MLSTIYWKQLHGVGRGLGSLQCQHPWISVRKEGSPYIMFRRGDERIRLVNPEVMCIWEWGAPVCCLRAPFLFFPRVNCAGASPVTL